MFDVLILNGLVVDGYDPWFRSDIAVQDGKIARLGKLESIEARNIIDAQGQIVSPGFIDIHNHSDATLLVNRKAESMVSQGCTTLCIGNCGISLAPLVEATIGDVVRMFEMIHMTDVQLTWHTFEEYLDLLQTRKLSVNVAALAGHGTVRAAVMGFENRAPTATELEQMKRLVAQCMREGAFGLSTGLAYPPGIYSTTDEIVELCKIVTSFGGFYATHIRGESKETFLPAIKEATEIGERASIPVQISHIESHYPAFGQNKDALRIVEDARTRGVDVTCDIPPYLQGAGPMASLLPGWVFEGGLERTLKLLADDESRRRIKETVLKEPKKYPPRSLAVDGHWDKLTLSSSAKNPQLVGKTLAQISEIRHMDPWEVVFGLLADEGSALWGLWIVSEHHREDEMQLVIAHHTSMIASDGFAMTPTGSLSRIRGHPRDYGVFPMVFRKYVRGETRRELPQEPGSKLLIVEEAVKKMTALPAHRLGITDRGVIREGAWADLVVFDPQRISDAATYENPQRFPTGINFVLVNGEVVVSRGVHTEALPGKVLRHRLS